MTIPNASNRDGVLDQEPGVESSADPCKMFGDLPPLERSRPSMRAGGSASDAAKDESAADAAPPIEPSLLRALQQILDFGRDALHVRAAILVLKLGEGDYSPHFLSSAPEGEAGEWVDAIRAGQGGLDTVLAEGRPVRLHHTARRSGGGPADRWLRVTSLLGIPMGDGGLFFVEKEDGHHFTDADERLALFLAEQAAAVVECAHLLAETRSRCDETVRAERLSAISTLASVIGHDLRNPLSVINNAIFFLSSKIESDDARVNRHLEIVRREIRQATRIIEELLDFSRDRAPQPAPAPLRVLLRDALASRRIDGQIRVEEELPADLPLLYVDVVQVRQALAHLLANAIEAMPEGGTLRVRAFACDAGVAVQIEDTGVGIPSEHRDRLFEPLFTTKPRGAGLGLALVQRVVAAHHGTIRIESEEGQGTTVTLLLPAAER